MASNMGGGSVSSPPTSNGNINGNLPQCVINSLNVSGGFAGVQPSWVPVVGDTYYLSQSGGLSPWVSSYGSATGINTSPIGTYQVVYFGGNWYIRLVGSSSYLINEPSGGATTGSTGGSTTTTTTGGSTTTTTTGGPTTNNTTAPFNSTAPNNGEGGVIVIVVIVLFIVGVIGAGIILMKRGGK